MLKAYYQLSTTSKKGRKLRSRSFVKAFIDLLYGWIIRNAVAGSVIDATGTSRTWTTANTQLYGCLFYSCAPYGDQWSQYNYGNVITGFQSLGWIEGDTMGIMVGSGTAAITTTDDNLQTPIAHGTGAGQLQYLTTFVPNDVTVSGSNCSFTIDRLFLNGSGGDVTVNEVGLYSAPVIVRAAAFPCCIIRDIVSPGVVVANGEYLKVSYTITVTV